MSKFANLVGARFGKLVVLSRTEDHVSKGGRHRVQYLCQCDCGNKCVVTGENLKAGNTNSCGCLVGEKLKATVTKHGKTNTRLYGI